MRAIARFGRYALCAQREIVEAYATGHTKVIQRELTARFREGGMTPEERELAMRSWTFNGYYQEQDEATPVAPDYRIGVFDSIQAQAENNWSDEERQIVEERLIAESALNPQDLLVVATPRLAPPWPNYDIFDGTLNALCKKIMEDGYDLEDVLVYEEANQDRAEVIAALNQLLAAEQKAEVEEVVG